MTLRLRAVNQPGGSTLVKKVSDPKAKQKDPFRIEEDWFAFIIGIILTLLVLCGVIKNIPW
jgi:hypothetical protein